VRITNLPANPHLPLSHHLLAFVWGMSEAVVFFVIPDVLITRAALGSLRAGMVATAYALAGSLLGGAISYVWGAADLDGARRVLDALPAISIGMLDHARQALASDGMIAALIGSFTGVPYKVFAVHAASANISLPVFLLASIPARAVRFVLLAMIVRALARYAVRAWTATRIHYVWASVWIVNYAIYWYFMPN
jgi:membrane protein YqaA with SNARE-associated domain